MPRVARRLRAARRDRRDGIEVRGFDHGNGLISFGLFGRLQRPEVGLPSPRKLDGKGAKRPGSGRSLPKEFALPGREGFVRQVRNAVLLGPLGPTAAPWTGFEAALSTFSDDFMTDRPQPALDAREFF